MEKITLSFIYRSFLWLLLIGVSLTMTKCSQTPEEESVFEELPELKSDSDDDDDSDSRNIYVKAGAPDGGDGTKKKPFNSLADVETNSLPGDKITVLFSGMVLDGGIALKEGQHLQGKKGPGGVLPQITNSSSDHLDGDAVRLTGGNNKIDHLHILDLTTFGSGIASKGLLFGNDDSGDFHFHDLLITGYGSRGIVLMLKLSGAETLEGRIEKVEIKGEGGGIEIFTDSDDGQGGILNLEVNQVVVEDIDPIRPTNTTGLRLSVLSNTQMNAVVTNSRFDNIRNGGGHREGILVQQFANAISLVSGVLTPLDPFFRLLPESAVKPGMTSSFTIHDVSVRNNEEEGIQIVTLAKDVESNITIEVILSRTYPLPVS